MTRKTVRAAFTIVELVAVIAVIVLVALIAVTGVKSARESARRTECERRLREIGLMLHNYHTAYESFPPMRCGTGAFTPEGGDPLVPTILPKSNGDQLGGWVFLLPYYECNPLYLQVVNGTGSYFSPDLEKEWRGHPWGPLPDPSLGAQWAPFEVLMPGFLCPSDDGGLRKEPHQYRRSNYAFCVGDSISNNDWVVPDPVTGNSNFKPPRGIFGWHTGTRIADIADGTSNTIAVSERVVCIDPSRVKGGTVPATVDENYAPSNCLAYSGVGGTLTTTGAAVTGLCSVNGHACFIGFTTCLPPNSPSCGLTKVPAGYAKGGSGGIYSPSSYHPGGVNCLFADGSVRFISDNIDAGDAKLSEAAPIPGVENGQTSKSPSRWGTWGALGSKASSETLGAF